MNVAPWWTGGRLLVASLAFAGAGFWLLSIGVADPADTEGSAQPGIVERHDRTPVAVPDSDQHSPDAAETSAAAHPDSAPQQGGDQSAGAPPAASAPAGAEAPVPGELPPPGSGPAADPLIQAALDRASPPDLPPATDRQLVADGRTAWLAETAVYTQVRIQAVTARRDTGGPAGRARAVVRLVWAGADRAGTFLDGRPAAVYFTQNGNGSWERTP